MKEEAVLQLFIIIGCYLILAQAVCDNECWQSYKTNCNKSYSDTQDEMRRKIFEENLMDIEEHNEQFEKNETTFKVKPSCKVSDSTPNEIYGAWSGFQVQSSKLGVPYVDNGREPPTNWDWRTQIDLGPVKDRKECSSSWAIAAVEAVQFQYQILTRKLIDPSYQELIDCSRDYGNQGCKGGRMAFAFNYMKDNGIGEEANYPYINKEGTCNRTERTSLFDVTGFMDIPEDINMLKRAIYQHGPAAVAVDSSDILFKEYAYGMYENDECSSYDVNHSMLAVGYGVEIINGKEVEYVTLKSCMGGEWGEKGFMRILATNNHCGVATAAIIPILRVKDNY